MTIKFLLLTDNDQHRVIRMEVEGVGEVEGMVMGREGGDIMTVDTRRRGCQSDATSKEPKTSCSKNLIWRRCGRVLAIKCN